MQAAANPRKQVGTDLTEGNILRLLIRFVIPLLLANLLQELYNAVDMAVIGHFVGSTGTVGVSIGGEIPGLLTFLATSFGSAGQIYVAQLAGAKEHKAISQTIGTSMTFMLILSLICSFISITFAPQMLRLLNCPEEAMGQAIGYMRVVSLGMPFIFGYNAICGILRGMGESKRPLMFIACAATANIILDILFVAVIPLEAVGTAIATAAAQMASFLSAALFLYSKRKHFHLAFDKSVFRLNGSHLKILLKLGIPLAAQSAMIHVTYMYCSAQINTYGLVASATNSIGSKVQRLINVFTMSINAGAGAMVGQNLGAKKFDRVKRIVYTCIALTSVFSVIAILIALFLPRQAYSLFTTDIDVIEFGVTYLRIVCIVFLLAPVQGSFGSVVTGSGFVKLNFFIGLLDGVILRLGISYLMAYGLNMGVLGFFYGNALARLGPVILSSWYFFSGKWKTRKLLMEQERNQKE